MTILEFNGKKPQIEESCYIAPSSLIIGDVIIEEKSSVWPNTTIRGDLNRIQIGSETSIQDGCIIHATKNESTIIGDCVTLGHAAIVHASKIGNYVLIGMGAMVMSQASIDDWAIVAAGSVVTEGTHVPSGTLAMGTPAKVVKNLNSKHLDLIKKSVKEYNKLRKSYMRIESEKKRALILP
jgi:carbonic anhydrase/acetyltransferase-like protein (isoleucine patch superfamily)